MFENDMWDWTRAGGTRCGQLLIVSQTRTYELVKTSTIWLEAIARRVEAIAKRFVV